MAGGVDVADHLLGHCALLRAGVEDLGAVDRTDDALVKVGPVNLEEHLQQSAVREALGIEDDFDDLGVTPVVLLRRVVILTAHEPGSSGDDSFGVAQQLLHDPGAASGKNRVWVLIPKRPETALIAAHWVGYSPACSPTSRIALAGHPSECTRHQSGAPGEPPQSSAGESPTWS